MKVILVFHKTMNASYLKLWDCAPMIYAYFEIVKPWLITKRKQLKIEYMELFVVVEHICMSLTDIEPNIVVVRDTKSLSNHCHALLLIYPHTNLISESHCDFEWISVNMTNVRQTFMVDTTKCHTIDGDFVYKIRFHWCVMVTMHSILTHSFAHSRTVFTMII